MKVSKLEIYPIMYGDNSPYQYHIIASDGTQFWEANGTAPSFEQAIDSALSVLAQWQNEIA